MIRMTRTLAAALALLSSLIGCSTEPTKPAPGAPGSPQKPLELITFPGGFNWPVWVAQDKGLFAKHGVAVKVTPTPNSVFQLTNLIDGKFDLAITAIDNLIAYREGQGEVDKPGPDLVAVMGGDNGFLRLTSVPEVKSIAELRGKTVSVDARTTGYAIVLFEIPLPLTPIQILAIDMGTDSLTALGLGVEKPHLGGPAVERWEAQMRRT